MTFDSNRLTPNSAEYQRQHRWVKKQMGKATHCSNNRTHKSNRYDWSNISKNYLSDISDWRQLCRACHRAYDPITEKGKKSISKKNSINSIGNQSHAKPVIAVFPDNSWIKYSSSAKASKALNVLPTVIANILNGWASKTRTGLTFRRIGG